MKILLTVYLSVTFGLLAGASQADEFEDAHQRFDARLTQHVEQKLESLVDQRLEEMATELEQREAYALNPPTAPDQGGRMQCGVSADQVFECTVVAQRAHKTDIIAGSAVPATVR
jgi:hypothetical protein